MSEDARDEELVARAKAGDGAAFGRLVERHYDLVFRVGCRLLGSVAEAEDLAQDVCVALPGKLDGFRGEARFTTWLYRVVVNAARDRQRRLATERRAWDGWAEVEAMGRTEARERDDDLAWLHQAMASLPDDLRETVALVLGEDLTHALAAQALGVSEGTVSWRMSEVRKALRAMVRQERQQGQEGQEESVR